MKKILMSVLTFGTLTTGIYAECWSQACSNVNITKLLLTASGTLYVGTNGDEGLLNCQSPGNSYTSLTNSDVGKNAMYAALLAAKASGEKVTIRIQEDSSDCRVLYVISN